VSLKPSPIRLGGEVRVPGSVANLGGGFDTLGVAVQLYLRARIIDVHDDGGTRLVVTRSTPPVTGGNALERGFEAAARRTGRRTPTVFVEVTSDVPMAAGLGSSAAATVAGLRIFEAVTEPLSEGALLAAATAVEGHADNAAPALFGGLNSVLEVDGGEPVALRWIWPADLRLVVGTPAVALATAKARAALPETMPRRDAIFNLQRVLALVHALQHGEVERLREAVKDRWHQPARASLVPLLDEALAIDHPDVLGAFLSGAGPSVALLARGGTDRVQRLLESMYQHAGVAAIVRTLAVHPGSSAAADVPGTAAGGGDVAAPAIARSSELDHATDAVASARERNAVEAFRETERNAKAFRETGRTL
jgi:homoserine kinase